MHPIFNTLAEQGNFFDKDLAKVMNLPTEYDAVRALSGKIHQIYVHGGDDRDVIVWLFKENDRLWDLWRKADSIAPKKHKVDGKITIWTCPEHLIPEPV